MYDFTILALPGAFASGVAAALDILSTAAGFAHRCGCGAIRWRVVSTEPVVALSNGVKVDACLLPEEPTLDRSIWMVPGLGIDSAAAASRRLSQPDAVLAAKALSAQAAGGGTVAGACSAVLLLQQAGVLIGKRATTTWWLGDLLQRLEPTSRVDVDQMVIVDGNVVTGGAAFAHLDVMLHLLRTRFNPSLAAAVAKAMVIDGRQLQDAQVLPAASAGGDELASRVARRFEAGLPHPPTIAQLAAELGMSDRTLARRIKRATGRSVSALLQSVRFSRARMLLQTSRMSVEQVAEQVGYADATSLRRLMRKVTMTAPTQFRGAVYRDIEV